MNMKQKVALLNALFFLVLSLNVQANTLKEKAALYLPMDQGRIIALPTSASIQLLGDEKPIFKEGKKGQALAITSEDISVKGIAIKGENIINGKEGTIAFWMKPLVPYSLGKGRHYFFTARKTNGHFVYIMSPTGGFYFQTLNDKRWISPQFNFSWWNKPQWSTQSWYHLAITWGIDKKTSFFINGNPIHTSGDISGASINVDTLFIGCSKNEKFQADALLDEFYLFNTILSKEEIGSLLND